MTITNELFDNNEAYAAAFDQGELPMPPAKQVAIVACMDARLDVYRILGLRLGEAHVIRNAGGVISEERHSLADHLPAFVGINRDRPDSLFRLRDAHLQ